MSDAYWMKSRKVAERIVISGKLKFTTPVAFSSGNDEGLVDISLITDPFDGRALLTGSTLAGALRSYLRDYEHGYRKKEGPGDLCSTLFGAHNDNDGSDQSWIITSDSLGATPQVELRDGVKIDPKTNTAEDKKKFDFELLQAGCTFDLKLEVMVPEAGDLRDKILQGLVICLEGLENGNIMFGVRKSRGFGKCFVGGWNVDYFDMKDPEGLIKWIENSKSTTHLKTIRDALCTIKGLKDFKPNIPDARNQFSLKAIFGIDGSLLIRSSPIDSNEPDVIHLKSKRDGKMVPILSGTSVAGVLRARGLKIAKTMGDEKNAKDLINDLFGNEDDSSQSSEVKSTPFASKIVVAETEIKNGIEMVQNRIKIDRFTGGAFQTALFNEQPVFGTEDTEVRIELLMKECSDAQIGLVLLLLKDLWTGDLPVGGGISIGRGRLKGKNAVLSNGSGEEWIFENKDGSFAVKGKSNQKHLQDHEKDPDHKKRYNLNDYVSAFLQEVKQ